LVCRLNRFAHPLQLLREIATAKPNGLMIAE
jgi:hypothetical protein